MMSICFTWFPIGGLGEPNIYHHLVDFTRKVEDCWRSFRQLDDCPTYTLEKVWEWV